VTARATAWVCGRSLAGTVGSNPAKGVDVYPLRVLCVVKQSSLRRVYRSYRGIRPTVVCLRDREVSIMSRIWPASGWCAMEKKNSLPSVTCMYIIVCTYKPLNAIPVSCDILACRPDGVT